MVGYAKKVDANQALIVKALERAGVSVEIIGKPLDLLCCAKGRTFLMEIKNLDGRDRLTNDQIKFIAEWPGEIHIVHTAEEAVAAAVGPEAMR